MKSLIITAHPSSKGHTHSIAKAYGENLTKNGHTFEIIDLYQKENELPFYAFEDLHFLPDNENRRLLQGKIMEANELVFIHPLWWSNMPAIMKNFLDHTFSAGFAFKYINNKPVGLLTGKTARVFITSGGPFWLYLFLGNPMKRIWQTAVISYCGMKMKSFIVADKMNMPPFGEEKEKSFNKFLEKVRNM